MPNSRCVLFATPWREQRSVREAIGINSAQNVVHLAFGDVNEGGDRAMQIEQRVHLDSGLMLAESGPGKERQTEIDGR